MKKITLSKEVLNYINNSNFTEEEDFIRQAERYIKATKENRLICNIDKVTASGMSCTMKFLEFDKSKNKGVVLDFWTLFKALGYTEVNRSGYFRLNGCGMDMEFNTHYNIIHNIYSMGFITKKQCDKLAQMKPVGIY